MKKQYTNALIGPARFSYPKLFKPGDLDGKYNMQLLIPKDDEEQVNKIKKAIEACKTLNTETLGNNTEGVRNPLRDGDGPKPQGGEYGPECRGHYVINVKSKNKPQVVIGPDRRAAEDYEVKGGDYGYATVTFYPYNTSGNKGIGAGLNNVWKTKDGTPLGGGFTTAEDDFGGIDTNKIDFDLQEVDPLTGAPIDSDFSEIL